MHRVAAKCSKRYSVREKWVKDLMEDFTCGFLQSLDKLGCGMSMMDVRAYIMQNCDLKYFTTANGNFVIDEVHCLYAYKCTGLEVYKTLHEYARCYKGLEVCNEYLHTYKFTRGSTKQSLLFRSVNKIETASSCRILPQFYTEKMLSVECYGDIAVQVLLVRLGVEPINGDKGYFLPTKELDSEFVYELCCGNIVPEGGIYSDKLSSEIESYYRDYFLSNNTATTQYSFEEVIYGLVYNHVYDGSLENCVFMDDNYIYRETASEVPLRKLSDMVVEKDYDIIDWYEDGQPVCIDGEVACLKEA